MARQNARRNGWRYPMKTPRPKFTGNQTSGQFIAGLYRRAAHILTTGKRLPPPSRKQK
jgi:hypothetical protein